MQSHSYPGRIMCTEKTKDLLVAAGKQHWVSARMDLVEAKGKGKLQCYWCNTKVKSGSEPSSRKSQMDLKSEVDTTSHLDNDISHEINLNRQVSWMTELLEGLLNEVLSNGTCTNEELLDTQTKSSTVSNVPRDEVSETLVLPKRQTNSCTTAIDKKQISSPVKMQLQNYITSIARAYRNNPFHNFEHACHVVMGTKKLLSRVTKPLVSSPSSTAYGITSDPLTQFAILFSALIHDVDHAGVSNAQLVLEESSVAMKYGNKSVAEQNSVSIAWDLLMQSEFLDLRNTIMANDAAILRFRQVLVNSVMATDLFDADLKLLRENRWEKAFTTSNADSDEGCNRRAAIIIEHILQASDVCHTMQHWHVYQKWNKKLFVEMHNAYKAGRATKDPTQGWYEGELGFFDYYIIPLAKKLKTCGVFGVSCDELLDYAVDNRAEWALKGRVIVDELIREITPSIVHQDEEAA
jgi:3'5'-cyclic nucleotide phosphodiesterase